jgi:hypothetical protein
MRQILVESCGKCPFFNEGETSYATGERWTDDSCLKGYGKIFDRDQILATCELDVALYELM